MSNPKRAGDRRSLIRYLQVVLFWNPLVCALITVYSGARPFFPRFLVSLCISAVVASFCFATVYALRFVEQLWFRRRGQPAPEHGTVFYMVQSTLAMPFGLFVAFRVVGLIFDFDVPFRLADYRFGLGLGLLCVVLFLLWEMRREAQLRVRELETRELQAQLAALTAQLNPHLLFNALNTVASLVHSDPDKAEETVVRLAELYRGVLASTHRATHALDEELRICAAYLGVEQARFGERLRTHVEVEEAMKGEQIPVLLLQPLVENAIKHGLSSRGSGGAVTIRGRRVDRELELAVEDDGIGLGASDKKGAGTGIDNARKRLLLSYGERATLSLTARPEGGTTALLRIPLGGQA